MKKKSHKNPWIQAMEVDVYGRRRPVVEIQLTKTPIVAAARKLTAKWHVEFEQHIECMYGPGIPKELKVK